MKTKSFMRLSLLGLAAAMASPAAAEEDLGGGWNVSGNVAIVSDYRFRGVSLSDEDPALQGGITLGHESGFYAGTWGSSIEDSDLYGNLELDFFVGYSTEIASGTTIDGGLLYYYYPNGADSAGDSDFFEPYVSVSHTIGPVTAKVGAAYAWSQDAIGNSDNIYLYGDLGTDIPGTPLSLSGHLGYSDGSLGIDADGNYLDWSLGVSATFGAVSLGVAYVDTDLPSVHTLDAGVVFSLGLSF